MKNAEAVMVGIISTSVFWLIVLLITCLSESHDAYRMGYAESKAGLQERYDFVQESKTK